MNLLLISWHYPPNNSIAALRVGKLGSFLHARGHAVRVVTADQQAGDRSLSTDIPAEQVHRTKWRDVDTVFQAASHRAGAHEVASATLATPSATSVATLNEAAPSFRQRIKRLASAVYYVCLHLPDKRIGWIPYATREGLAMAGADKPDFIYVSGPPFSAFISASRISRKTGVPLILEFRDPWVDDPYDSHPAWRRWLETRIERYCLKTAVGVVTVSQPWADFFAHKFGKPTLVMYNGYDPADFPIAEPPADRTESPLSLVHVGTIYPGRRDPTPLFQAIRQSKLSPQQVRVCFYGDQTSAIAPLARDHGVAEFVTIGGLLPYPEALARQREADILLLLQWDDPREAGHVPGKLFEYFGSLRPILGVGLETGVPATLIRKKAAGLFSKDPGTIAEQLETWVALKHGRGYIPALAPETRNDFVRDKQYRKLEAFLEELKETSRKAVVPPCRDKIV